MASPRRSGRLMMKGVRRSLRLWKGSFCEHEQSPALDVATPRTVFKKVLQTQPVVSPLVLEKADSPKPAETVFQFPSRNAADSNLEISLSGPIPKETFQPVLLKHGKKKKIRLSEFERALDKQLPSTTAESFLDNTSLTRSLQVSLGTPVSRRSDGRRGLIRRPQSYKGVNVVTFEEGMEQNLLQIKGSQNYLVDLQASVLSNATGTINADTELFTQPQLTGQSTVGLPVLPSRPVSARKSLSQENMLAADLHVLQESAESDIDVGMTWQNQKDSLMPNTECTDDVEGLPNGRDDSQRREEQQESEQAIEEGMISSGLKEGLTPDTKHATGMDSEPQQRTPSPHRGQQESQPGNDRLEPRLSPEKDLSSAISTPKSSTPVHAELPVAPTGGLRAFLHEKPTKRSVKAMVEHIIEELDRNVAPCVMEQGAPEVDLEEELSPSRGATWISQMTGAGTPRRSISRQEPEQLEVEAVDGVVQQSGDRSGPNEVSVMESEADVVSEDEMEPEVEGVLEAEMDPENTGEPYVRTPAFVRLKTLQCSHLLSTPHTLKKPVSKSAPEQPSKKQVAKGSKKACRKKREPGLPSSWVKKLFCHYARMPVAKVAFQAVERCVALYFKHLSDDLEAYTKHAKRKTIDLADLELLMRRQGLITDKMPLNVLIERHLPLEYRKLLIPVATSGNKVVPLNPRGDFC